MREESVGLQPIGHREKRKFTIRSSQSNESLGLPKSATSPADHSRIGHELWMDPGSKLGVGNVTLSVVDIDIEVRMWGASDGGEDDVDVITIGAGMLVKDSCIARVLRLFE
jgi:hypothetical protein